MSDDLMQFAQRVRELKDLPERVAPRVANALDTHIKGTVAAGTDADGRKWAPTKAGNPDVMKNAQAAVTVRAIGPVAVARVTGHHALHDLDIANGAPRRGILPDATMPPKLEQAISRAIDGEVERVLSR